MKKLLVIPIMLIYYLVMLVAFPLQIENTTCDLSASFEEYFMKPFARIYGYALTIMKSDKTIKWIHEASERLKQGKPIDKEG